MDFAWSPEQDELFDAIERFASAELNTDLIARDRAGVFNRDGWKRCAELGIQGLPVPAEFGGLGQDPLTTVGALERLGYGCRDNGLVFSLNAQMWTVAMPLVAFGTDEQQRRFLPGLCGGSLIGASAMTEPASGSDAYALETTAVKRGDRYVLNGSKAFVTNGPIADLFVVFATLDRTKGAPAITAFLLERSCPGLQAGKRVETMGLRTSPMGELFLEDCQVEETLRLGAEGAGVSLFTHAMAWERGCILAGAVGGMRRLLESSLRYAKERTQFGRAIGEFQLVGSKLVDMKLRLETARGLLYQAAYQRSQGRVGLLETALAKLYISECWVQSCQDALQIHGGYGYMVEYEVERELRDALASRLHSGTNEMQRNIIAGLLR